ncbi:hypothetical protein TNCV_3934501 [Trichonephila clavipes]|nr:hypothetical protein TNCV_3934501 [Trichonephila clavipes]
MGAMTGPALHRKRSRILWSRNTSYGRVITWLLPRASMGWIFDGEIARKADSGRFYAEFNDSNCHLHNGGINPVGFPAEEDCPYMKHYDCIFYGP